MQTILTSKQMANALPLIFKISLTIKNLIFILAALLSVTLWVLATLKTPERLDKVEAALHTLSSRQNKIEGEIKIISQDSQIIKNILLNRSHKK